MEDETEASLLRSLKEERQLVLLPRLHRLEEALKEILALTQQPTGQPAKLRVLLNIQAVAEEALAL